jgi:transcriptional regulator with XRE-family HTH domain
MVTHIPSPTTHRRRLAATLRGLREARGLTLRQVATSVDYAQSTMTRIETGRIVRVRPALVEALLDLYEVEDEHLRAELLRLARESAVRGWWHAFRDVVPEGELGCVGLETTAGELRQYQGQLVPVLLRTEDYARAVLRSARPDESDDRLDRAVDVVARRQRLLHDEGFGSYWVVLDEAVLHRVVGGPAVMRAQLDQLHDAAEWPRLTLQVLPFAAGAHPALDQPFVMMSFREPSDQPIVYLDRLAAGGFVDRQADVRRYEVLFRRLMAAALSPESSAELIARVAKEF